MKFLTGNVFNIHDVQGNTPNDRGYDKFKPCFGADKRNKALAISGKIPVANNKIPQKNAA